MCIRDRSLRGHAARHRPRAEVRRASDARAAPGRADARRRRGRALGRGPCRPRAAAPVARTCPRLQPGTRAGAAPGTSGGRRADADAKNRIAGRPAGGQASRERARRVCVAMEGAGGRPNDRPRGRREHDRRDAQRVRESPPGRGSDGRPGAYGCASRGATAVRTSAATTSFGLSLIHISEPTRLGMISYAVFCLKKKNNDNPPHKENPPTQKQKKQTKTKKKTP